MEAISSRLLTPVSTLAASSQRAPLDAVVVGGGSAGITAARTIVEAGLRVAVLEAGPLVLLTHLQSTDLRFDPDLARSVQQSLSYSPESAAGGAYGSLIGCVGGRGLFWNGAAPRFAPENFTGWPVSAAELAPFYSWAEEQFRVTTGYGSRRLTESVVARLQKAGLLAVAGPYAVDCHPTSDGWLAGTVGNSLSALFRSALLTTKPVLLTLTTRAFACRLLVNAGIVQGVEAVDLSTGNRYTIATHSVVLAAGAFESVRLALVSKIPDPNGLIGRYITDHLFVRAYYPLPSAVYDPDKPEVAIVWIPANPAARFQFEIHLPADNLFTAKEGITWKPDESSYYAAMVRSFAPIEPRAENFIEPLPGDAPGCFRVHLSLNGDDQAIAERQLVGMEQIREALGAAQADVQTMPLGASHHEAGGLMIGANPSNSVADPFGAVRSVKGLVVGDAGAWPDVSPANPHLTIVAMARRQALHLANRLREQA